MWLMALELSDSTVAVLLVLSKLPRQGSCGGCGGCPGKGLAGGVYLALLLFVSLVLVLPCLSCASVSLRLPSSALLSVAAGAALTARAQVDGYKKGPYFCTLTGTPGPGPHISATRCWAGPRTMRGHVGGVLLW